MFPEWHHAVPESAYFIVPETLKTFRMYSISRFVYVLHWLATRLTVAAVTTSCQLSQANVGRLIIGFLPEGLLLLFSYDSNLSRSRRSKNNERDSRIYWPMARAGTWKIPNNLHYNSWRWCQSFFALNISVGVRQFP